MTAGKRKKTLAAVIRRATTDLPKGWEIDITIADGLATVAAGKGDKYVDMERHKKRTLADQIDFCLRAAITHELIRGKDRRRRA